MLEKTDTVIPHLQNILDTVENSQFPADIGAQMDDAELIELKIKKKRLLSTAKEPKKV